VPTIRELFQAQTQQGAVPLAILRDGANLSLRPTPRGRVSGAIADALTGVDEFARSPFGVNNPPGAFLSDLLGIPAVARTMDRVSYGEPLITGRNQTLRMLPDTAEAALTVAPGVSAAARGVPALGRAAVRELGPTAAAAIERQLARQGAILGVVEDSGRKAAAGSGKAAKKGGKKPRAIGNLFDEVDDPALALAMARRGEHIKRDAAGNLVGAPGSVDTPQQLGAMRRRVDAKAAEGDWNADWYDRARQAAVDLSADPAQQNLFVRGGAAYSPQATPSVEVNDFTRQYNDFLFNQGQLVPRTRSQADNVRRGIEAGDGSRIRLGKKTGPYADAKNPTIPDESLYKTANDIWHGRVFGYTNPDGTAFSRGFTPQEHGFLTGENLLMSDRLTRAGVPVGSMPAGTPWTPRRGQAATWGAERERQYVDVFRRQAGRDPTPGEMADIRNRAAYGIDDAVERNTGYVTGEMVPGAGLQHLSGVKDLSPEFRQAFSDDRFAALSDPQGRSLLLSDLGMYTRPATRARGEYVNSLGQVETNPVYVDRPILGLRPAEAAAGRGPTVQATDAAAMDAITNLQGLVTAQEAVPWHKLSPANSSMTRAGMTGARLIGNPDEVVRIKDLLAGNRPGAFNWPRGDSLGVVDTGDGYTVMDFGGSMTGREVQDRIKAAMREAQQAGPTGVTFQPGRKDGGYSMPFQDDTGAFYSPGSGGATSKMLEQVQGVPRLEQRLDAATQWRAALERLNQLDMDTAARTGMATRPDLMRLREIISRQGISGLREWVAKNGPAGLPAFLLPFVAAGTDEAPAD
jgi:hypothetical protein